jgi:hypothetical protein
MQYRSIRTREVLEELRRSAGHISAYDDFVYGSEYLNAVNHGDISPDDIVLLFSIDGAQLYQTKASDCWMFIWVIFNHGPESRYKKFRVEPGGTIPGPNKPKHADSFLFPTFHHLAALQHEGLHIWDSLDDRVFISHPFFAIASADAPGMTYINGLVGHQGAFGCRFYCPVKGRRRQDEKKYYPAHLKPDGINVPGSDHPDYDVYALTPMSLQEYALNLAHVMASPTNAEYLNRRRDTGISNLSSPPHAKCPRLLCRRFDALTITQYP